MKHIKRVKTAITTLAMGEEKGARRPAVVMFMHLPKSTKVAHWEDNSAEIPLYEIYDIQPVDSTDRESVKVNVSFVEAMTFEETQRGTLPANYTVTMDLHHIVLAKNLSTLNEHLSILVVPYNLHAKHEGLIKNTDIALTVNFPDRENPIYGHLTKQLSMMVDTNFTEPLYPESALTGTNASGLYNIPVPIRRFQMAIMPLISALALDDTHAFKQLIQMEKVFNEFHERNFNEDDDLERGEYLSILNALRDSTQYNSPTISDESIFNTSMEYSILDNMSDAMETHIKEVNPEITDPSYFKDLSLLILLRNTMGIYASSNSDSFLSALPVVSEDSSEETSDHTHIEFMNLVGGLTDVFDEVEAPETEMEKKRRERIEWWNQTPDQNWPEGLPKLKEELLKMENSEDYFAIMKETLEDYAQTREVVSHYSLGKVFTAMVLRTSLNLHKMKVLQDTDNVHGPNSPKPYSLIAKQWIDQPTDDYMWELPAMSYALANYDVDNFISLLQYRTGNTANYCSVTIQSLTLHIIDEAWDRANLEYLLVEHTGMPKKERELLLTLVDEIHEVVIDKDEVAQLDEDEIKNAIAFYAVKSFIENGGVTIDDASSMIAYSIPAFADIFVNTIPEFREEEDEDEEAVHIGSVEWKRQRVLYIETVLDRVSAIIERKSA